MKIQHTFTKNIESTLQNLTRDAQLLASKDRPLEQQKYLLNELFRNTWLLMEHLETIETMMPTPELKVTCPYCKSNRIRLIALNWQCNNCKSFTCGVVWYPYETIALNATSLNVSIEDYKAELARQGNDIIRIIEEYEGMRKTLESLGHTF